jgi:hypothetical protein
MRIRNPASGTPIAWKSGQTTYVPLWDRMEGAWLWTRIKKYPKLIVSVPLVGALPMLNKRFVEASSYRKVQVFQTIYIEGPHVQVVLVPKDAIILTTGIGFHVKFKRILGLRQCQGLGKPWSPSWISEPSKASYFFNFSKFV